MLTVFFVFFAFMILRAFTPIDAVRRGVSV